MLTTGLDNIEGGTGNDKILGLVDGTDNTLTLGDVIDGSGGVDTLSITTDQATVNLAVATVTNVEMLDVNMDATAAPTGAVNGNAGTVNLNSVAYTKATIEGVTGRDAANADSDALTVNNANLATTVVLEDITDVASTVNFAAASGTSDEASVEVAGSTDDATTGQNNDLTVANVETLNLAFTTAANDLNVVSAAAAKEVNVTVAEDANTTLRGGAALGAAKTVNVDAAGDLTLAATADLADGAAITVSGAGDVDLNTLDNGGDGITLDASASTGKVTVTGAADTVSITTGSGDDKVTTGAVATAVALGAGADWFSTGSLDFGAAAAKDVDAGEGRDTLNLDDGSEFDAAATAHFKNFEVLDVVGGTGTYDVDQIALEEVTVSGDVAATDVTITDITDEKLTITGNVTNELTYELKDASGTSDALTVNIAGEHDKTDDKNDLSVADITVAGVETITLASDTDAANVKGTMNSVLDLNTDATKVVVTGDHKLMIGEFYAADGTTVNTSIKTIDASASAGLVMGAAVSTADVSLIGSDQADTLLVGTVTGATGGGAGADDATGSTINAGKGGDIVTITDPVLAADGDQAVDTLIIDAGDSMIGYVDTNANGSYADTDDQETFDVVTGFTSGEDTIDLGSFGFTGQKASGLAAGSLAAGAATDLVNGNTTSIADFFVDTGVQRGVAIVDNYDASAIGGAAGSTLVFIDTDGDGSLDVANDDMIVLSGTSTAALGDFGF
jgi:hypothetical protein